MRSVFIGAIVLLFVACGTLPSTKSPTTAPTTDAAVIPSDILGAYLNSGAMGQATEKLNNQTAVQPVIHNYFLFGKSKLRVAPDGTTVTETEGMNAQFAESVTINPAITVGDCEGGDVSSGGGGTAGAQERPGE